MVQIQRVYAEEFTKRRDQVENLIRASVEINFPTHGIEAGYAEGKCDDVEAHLRDGSAYVFFACEGDELLGWLWSHRIERPGSIRLHVAEIAVRDDTRSRGIGSKMLRILEDFAKEKGFREIDLLVTASNQTAVSFYENNSFVTERLLMKKDLFA